MQVRIAGSLIRDVAITRASSTSRRPRLPPSRVESASTTRRLRAPATSLPSPRAADEPPTRLSPPRAGFPSLSPPISRRRVSRLAGFVGRARGRRRRLLSSRARVSTAPQSRTPRARFREPPARPRRRDPPGHDPQSRDPDERTAGVRGRPPPISTKAAHPQSRLALHPCVLP